MSYINLQMQQFSHSQRQRKARGNLSGSLEKLLSSQRNYVLLGICAMRNKAESKPMREVIGRMKCKNIRIVELYERLSDLWESWPRVDALICFYSRGFPYLKAWKYIKRHSPFLINDYDQQELLWDRSVVYYILKKLSVPTPNFYLLCRDVGEIDRIINESYGTADTNKESAIVYNEQLRSLQIAEDEDGRGRENFRGKVLSEKLLDSPQKVKDPVSLSEHKWSGVSRGISQRHLKQNEQLLPSILKDLYRVIHFTQRSQCKSIQENDEDIVILTQKSEHKFKKPFVEKPFNSLNPEICIYYPANMGGGRKRMFNKKINECSTFEPSSEIRRDTNYIYENFIPENGFIIKVYTVGVNYMYAEARKSPALDGIVFRNKDGKEARYPIILTPQEKFMCKKIVIEFEQEVCGIKLLRSEEGKSYILGVDGWSLAKSNVKYWEDCAYLLKKKLLNHFFPHQHLYHAPVLHLETENNYRPPTSEKNVKVEELRSIVIISRHADRSPKEKLKIKTKEKRFIALFQGSPSPNEIKYRDIKNLKKMLDLANETLQSIPSDSPEAKEFMQMKLVLEAGGQFEGLTHKIQMKVTDRDEKGKIKKIVIALKWGGELSYTGYEDALQLGELIRDQRYIEHDILNLYSSYRHDIKTYSSEEGRCIKTAAAFLKGFLNLEGELAPIMTSMVTVDQKAQRLLDCTPGQNHSELLERIQSQLSALLNSQEDLSTSFLKYCSKSEISESMLKNITEIGSPRKKIEILYKLLKQLVADIEKIEETSWSVNSLQQRTDSHQNLQDENACEDILLVKERWSKLLKDFYSKDTNLFNVSKLPEIYDTAKHDHRKNKLIFNLIDSKICYEIKKISKKLAYFVVPNEVGLTDDEKIKNGTNICIPLLEKVVEDLSFWKTQPPQQEFWKYKTTEQDSWKHLRTRLYFTSASHLYSLLHLLTLGSKRKLLEETDEEERSKIRNILYMGYLSHVEFREYENLTVSQDNCCRFRIEISISYEFHKGKPIQEYKLGGKHLYLPGLENFLKEFIENYQAKFNSPPK